MLKTIVGDTVRFTWVDTGSTVNSSSWTLQTGSETVVGTGTLTDSGNGHYFADVTLPDTPGYYRIVARGYVGSAPYVRAKRLRTILGEVD